MVANHFSYELKTPVLSINTLQIENYCSLQWVWQQVFKWVRPRLESFAALYCIYHGQLILPSFSNLREGWTAL